MAAQHPSPSAKRSRWLWLLAGTVALGALLAVSGFTYAANQEEHDAFCASCHTEPESTYVGRSTGAQPVDLASFHTTEQTRCIDCHSGSGIPGRMQAELLGARNAALWYSHTAVQPATLTQSIADANCLKCHQDVTQEGYQPKRHLTFGGQGWNEGGEAGPNHWHEHLARWQASDPNAAACTGCHPAHTTDGTPESGFQTTQTTGAVCDACHQALGREG